MAVSIVGARRCGKTYRTHQLFGDLSAAGLQKESVCRLQFNDHRLSGLTASDLSIIDFSYYSLFPERRRGEKEVWFIFDEIQRIDGWEDYVLSLLETSTHRIVLTGSTSKLLRGEIASGLRGKNFPQELFPFSFREFARHYNVAEDSISSSGQALLRNLFEKYLNQGGFPGLLNLEADQHMDLLQSYWDTMIIRDIAEAHPHDEINISGLTALGQSLAARIGCPITIRKLAENLRETGLRAAPETLHKFVDYFSEAFMLFSIPIFSQSDSVRNRNYHKVYAIDWALADAVATGSGLGVSRKLENMVFIELKRRGNDLYYFKTRKDHEIDFVTTSRRNRSRKVELFQVCYKIDTPETLERELRGVPEAASFLGADRACVITMDEEKDLTVEGCKIRLVPAWKWFLE
ncbi:MAG: ATP-binding protein [Chitinivibrionales bacterium]